MKKIFLVVCFTLISVFAFSQIPFRITNKTLKLKWGSDSVQYSILNDSVYFLTSADRYYFNKPLAMGEYLMPLHKGAAGKVLTMSATGDSLFWGGSSIAIDTASFSYIADNANYLHGLDTSTLLNRYWNRTNDSITTNYNAYVNGNFTSTNGNFLGSNHGWFCGYDTLFEGALKIAAVGKLKGSYLTGTYRVNGNAYIENTDYTFFGFEKKIGGVKIKGSSVLADTNKITIMREINDKRMATTYSDTAIITEVMDKMIMSADSGGNHFKIYVPTITNNLTVHGTITSGGLINKDTVISLADDETFNFPTTSVGWAEIQCDSSLIEKTWGNVSWNGDGATTLRSNGAKFVNTDIDGNYACFYDGGSSYAILKNTSGYTQTYSIKYHYHY